MKKLSISIALAICLSTSTFAQSSKLQSGDSIRVELERTAISKELTQLRDSIDQSLKIFDSRIKSAQASKRAKLVSARKELIEYRDLVKLDVKEVSLTAKNAWTHDAVERIQANTFATRREYKRIRGGL